MREFLCKDVLNPLLKAGLALLKATCIEGLVAGAFLSPYWEIIALVRSSESDWGRSDCPGLYRCDIESGDVCEVEPAHQNIKISLGFKPPTRVGIEMINLVIVKTLRGVRATILQRDR